MKVFTTTPIIYSAFISTTDLIEGLWKKKNTHKIGEQQAGQSPAAEAQGQGEPEHLKGTPGPQGPAGGWRSVPAEEGRLFVSLINIE